MSQTRAQLLGPVLGDVNYDSGTLFVDSVNNRIGIGTTNPTTKLDVNGPIRGRDYFITESSTTRDSLGILNWVDLGPSDGEADRATAVQLGDVSGAKYAISSGSYDLSFYKHVSTGSWAQALQITATSATDEAPTVSVINSIGVGTTTPKTRIHSHESGTTVPAATAISYQSGLVVSGEDGNIDLLSRDDDSNISNSISMGRFDNTTGEIIHKWGIVTWANTGNIGSNTGNRIGVHYGTVANVWDSTELISVTSAGNVGLGTTNPTTKLDIRGNIIANRIQLRKESATIGGSSANAANAVIQIGDTTGQFIVFDTNEIQQFATTMNLRGEDGFKFYTGDAADANSVVVVDITQSGNVGIGTTNTLVPLHVYDDVTNRVLLLESGDSETSLAFKDPSTTSDTSSRISAIGNDLYITTSDSERIRISSTGNIGIGTTNPGVKLDVNGHVRSTKFRGVISTSGDGQDNAPFQLESDYNSYMVATAAGAAQANGNLPTWGLFWAGNQGAAYGTNGLGGPGNIWNNAGNPNEFVFVGNNSTLWSVHGNTGNTWQSGSAIVSGKIGIGTGAPTADLQIVDTVVSGAGASLSLVNKSNSTGAKVGIFFGVDAGDAGWSDAGNAAITVENANNGTGVAYGLMKFRVYDSADSEAMKICGDGNRSTSADGGGMTLRNGVAFANAGVAIDSGWGSYPGIMVFNQNAYGNTSRGEFRIHGWNRSYGSYPLASGSDFGVNLRIDGASYLTGSDVRHKTNIVNNPYGLKEILQLQPRKFNRINSEGEIDDNQGDILGFIAQEVIEIIPEAVNYYPEEDIPNEIGWCRAYSLSDSYIVSTLVNAVKEQNSIIESLISRIETLENK